jgi:hypothetical protein
MMYDYKQRPMNMLRHALNEGSVELFHSHHLSSIGVYKNMCLGLLYQRRMEINCDKYFKYYALLYTLSMNFSYMINGADLSSAHHGYIRYAGILQTRLMPKVHHILFVISFYHSLMPVHRRCVAC